MKEKQKLLSRVCSILGLLIGGVILLYLIWYVKTTMDVGALLAAMRPSWLVGAALCIPLSVGVDGLIIYRMGRGAGAPVSLMGCLDAAYIGEFYYKLGPAGAPVQIGLMHGAGMSATTTASVYTWKAVANTMVYTACAVAALIFKLVIQRMNLGAAVVGVSVLIGLYVLLCTAVLLFIRRPDPVIALARRVLVALSHRVALLRAPNRVEAMMDKLNEVRCQLQELQQNRRVLWELFALMLVELTALFSIPFFLYHGLGLSGHSYADLLLTQCLVMVLSRVVLLPGNAGGAEGSFYLFMTPIFGATLPIALVLWRCAAFLEVLLLGGLCSVLRFVRQTTRQEG